MAAEVSMDILDPLVMMGQLDRLGRWDIVVAGVSMDILGPLVILDQWVIMVAEAMLVMLVVPVILVAKVFLVLLIDM
jgi:hypothetical protein